LHLTGHDPARRLVFGAPAPQTVEALNDVLGASSQEQTTAGCSTVSWACEDDAPNILDFYVRDGRLIGYHGGAGYQTAQGLGFGATLGEFKVQHAIQASGTDAQGQQNFTTQAGFRIVSEGADADSGIVALLAGEECELPR